MQKDDLEGSVEQDIDLVSKISDGDGKSWERFVHSYSGWVLYRARKWCESHCPVSMAEAGCGLLSIHRKMEGHPSAYRREECDEGMDIYIWIFQQLQKRVSRYSGRNKSRLSTFVWQILNSRELYIDWLRWRYGRVI
ncbi:MAG: hypothetical protein OEY64_07815 [Nitrospinota bacterium]|nr:hypothetical protein [Nitrospinota bacterium]